MNKSNLGYKIKSGQILNKFGKKISLILYHSTDIKNPEKQNLNQLTVELRNNLNLDVILQSKSKMGLNRILANPDEHNWDLIFISKELEKREFIDQFFRIDDKYNYGDYQNRKVQTLIVLFDQANGSERLKLGQQIHKELVEDVAIISLYSFKTYAIHHKNLKPFLTPYYFFDKPYKWEFR